MQQESLPTDLCKECGLEGGKYECMFQCGGFSCAKHMLEPQPGMRVCFECRRGQLGLETGVNPTCLTSIPVPARDAVQMGGMGGVQIPQGGTVHTGQKGQGIKVHEDRKHLGLSGKGSSTREYRITRRTVKIIACRQMAVGQFQTT